MAFTQRDRVGTVLRVVDGDTYKIVSLGSKKVDTLTVRLVNVDCPEIYFVPKKRAAQEFGDSAKFYVKELIEGKDVKLTTYGTDRYGRKIAFVKIGEDRLDDVILSRGWGWYYTAYHEQKPYLKGKKMMESAKSQKIGLWAYPNPIPPSKYRNQ